MTQITQINTEKIICVRMMRFSVEVARISIVFQGILAYWFTGQTTDFRKRIFWAVAIFFGVLIIGMATP